MEADLHVIYFVEMSSSLWSGDRDSLPIRSTVQMMHGTYAHLTAVSGAHRCNWVKEDAASSLKARTFCPKHSSYREKGAREANTLIQ